MFEFHQAMFDNSPSMSSIILHPHVLDHPKLNPGHLFLRQQRTVEIIQLVEGPPPPPRRITSVINSSCAGSSSSSYYSSEYDSSPSEEEAESVCSSYCSSDDFVEQPESEEQEASRPDETYTIRMKRIMAWRENFSTDMSTLCSGM